MTVRDVMGDVDANFGQEIVVFNKADLVSEDDRLVLRVSLRTRNSCRRAPVRASRCCVPRSRRRCRCRRSRCRRSFVRPRRPRVGGARERPHRGAGAPRERHLSARSRRRPASRRRAGAFEGEARAARWAPARTRGGPSPWGALFGASAPRVSRPEGVGSVELERGDTRGLEAEHRAEEAEFALEGVDHRLRPRNPCPRPRTGRTRAGRRAPSGRRGWPPPATGGPPGLPIPAGSAAAHGRARAALRGERSSTRAFGIGQRPDEPVEVARLEVVGVFREGACVAHP